MRDLLLVRVRPPSYLFRRFTSFTQICQMLAEANPTDRISLQTPTYARSRDNRRVIIFRTASLLLGHIETAILSNGFIRDYCQSILERVAQNTTLLTPSSYGGNITLAAAIHDVLVGPPSLTQEAEAAQARDSPTNLRIHRLLSIDDSYINTPSFSCRLSADDLYFPEPVWTTWTSFLFAVGLGLRTTRNKRSLSNTIEVFLEHGADPSACFILCDSYRIRKESGDTEGLNGDDITDVVFYATLPAMADKWGLPLTPKTRLLLETQPYESGGLFAETFRFLAEAFRVLGATKGPVPETDQLTIRELDAQELASRDFTTVKVVTLSQLREIKRNDLKEALNPRMVDPNHDWEDETIWF